MKLPPRDKGRPTPQARVRVPRPAPYLSSSKPSPPRSAAPPKPTDENWPHRRTAETNRAERIEVADKPLSPILRGEAPDGTGIKFAELRVGVCRWPRGDPAEPDFEFCGGKSLPDLPYCAPHSRLAYAPPKARAAADNWALHRADTKS
jgi:GcrA cell cycle regulator